MTPATQPLLSKADLHHLVERFLPAGTVIRLGFYKQGYELRERLDGIIRCPRCGKENGCWSDTESWTDAGNGQWKHEFFGPGNACCECGQVVIDTFDGAFALEM